MTKIIAVLNHKGGVGKTTTTINLAAALQQKKKRVLAIDMDGQANLTESFGLSIEEEQTVYGAMKGKYPLPLVETAGGVTVVPSCLDLSAAEAELINEPGRELILNGLIGKLLENRKFDYILIDCPPSLGLLTLNALTAADYLIIPVQAQFLAMRGMAKIMNVIATVQERLNPKLAIGGIVITQFDKRKTLNKSVAELVKDSFCEKVFKTVIRDNVSLAEAPSTARSLPFTTRTPPITIKRRHFQTGISFVSPSSWASPFLAITNKYPRKTRNSSQKITPSLKVRTESVIPKIISNTVIPIINGIS